MVLIAACGLLFLVLTPLFRFGPPPCLPSIAMARWLLARPGTAHCIDCHLPASASTGGLPADRETFDGTSAPAQLASGVSFTLEDGEQYHRGAPDTLEIPPRSAREAVRPNQIVKLMFKITVDGESLVERMWVVVERRDADGYVGVLDNQPQSTEKMQPGMRIRFQPRHVIDVYPQGDDGEN
jgi:hypothetical protein